MAAVRLEGAMSHMIENKSKPLNLAKERLFLYFPVLSYAHQIDNLLRMQIGSHCIYISSVHRV